MKREAAWKAREARIAEKDAQVLQRVVEGTDKRRREEAKRQERNLECVKQFIAARQLVFEGQLQRKKEREEAFVAEEEKIAKYHEARSLPVKVKTKGRFSPAEIARKQALEREASAQFLKRESSGDGLPQVLEDGEAEGEGEAPEAPAPEAAAEAGGEAAEPKKGRKTVVSQAQAVDTAARDNEKSILDEVDLKMRADLEKQEKIALLQKQREVRIEEMRLAREERENQHMKEYRAQIREKELQRATREAEQRVILTQRDQEEREARERQRQDKERLQRLRENNVAAVERRRMERLEAGS
mmetsp:Transcript_110089/g.298571  ORF Transcript_110089/g.298571 Transcript_110089/m.298571 type:complete len:300 (-) Transcript_110089:161-1060(-)